MLDSFFYVNMPYGMKKNNKGEWFCFNREYQPLGFSTIDNDYDGLPVWGQYNFSDSFLEQMAWDPQKGIKHDEQGYISEVYFYQDAMLKLGRENWTRYWKNLERISSYQILFSKYSENQLQKMLPKQIMVDKNTFIPEDKGWRRIMEAELKKNNVAICDIVETKLKPNEYVAAYRYNKKMIAFRQNQLGQFCNLLVFGDSKKECFVNLYLKILEEPAFLHLLNSVE